MQVNWNAVALCVLQIGELTGRLTEDFKNTYNEMPWNQIKAMRNVVAHNYGRIEEQFQAMMQECMEEHEDGDEGNDTV